MSSPKSQGERIAALEATVASEGTAIRDHIDAKFDLLVANLQPYRDLKETVDAHTKQIAFWRGALAILAFCWTGALAYFGIHHQ